MHPFHKRRIQSPTQSEVDQRRVERRAWATAHDVGDAHDFTAAVGFLDLSVEQVGQHLPLACPPTGDRARMPEVSCERVEVEVQTITREGWKAAWSQALTEFVDDTMCR